MAKLITLDPDLPSTGAAGLLAELKKLKGHPVHVNGSAVNRISTLCLQILVSASATWKADGVSFHIVEPSEAMSDAMAILALGKDHMTMDAFT